MDISSTTDIPKYANKPLSGSKDQTGGKVWSNKELSNIKPSGRSLLDTPVQSFNNSNDTDELQEAKAKLKNSAPVDNSSAKNEMYNRVYERDEILSSSPSGALDGYWQFDDYVNNISGLSDQQSDTIKNSIVTVMNSEYSSRYDNGYSMTAAQTNFELKFVSQNLIPEQYQEGFNSLIEKYTSSLSKNEDECLEGIVSNFANSKDSNMVKSGFTAAAEKKLEDLKDGTDISQTTRGIYNNLYEGIKNSDVTTVKQNLESVYNNYIQNGKAYEDKNITSEGIVSNVVTLKEKWNSLMYVMGYGDDLMFKTSINNLV